MWEPTIYGHATRHATVDRTGVLLTDSSAAGTVGTSKADVFDLDHLLKSSRRPGVAVTDSRREFHPRVFLDLECAAAPLCSVLRRLRTSLRLGLRLFHQPGSLGIELDHDRRPFVLSQRYQSGRPAVRVKVKGALTR